MESRTDQNWYLLQSKWKRRKLEERHAWFEHQNSENSISLLFLFQNTSEKKRKNCRDKKRLLSAFLFRICPSERWMAGDFMPQTALVSAFAFSIPSLDWESETKEQTRCPDTSLLSDFCPKSIQKAVRSFLFFLGCLFCSVTWQKWSAKMKGNSGEFFFPRSGEQKSDFFLFFGGEGRGEDSPDLTDMQKGFFWAAEETAAWSCFSHIL